jgi:simple sugar transport system ATP-binding protein
MMLILSGVRKSYGPNLRVVEGLDLCLGGGRVCGVVGENGAGKSAMLAMLSGHESPDEGRIMVRVGGRDFDVEEYPRLVAWIPQTPQVVDEFDAEENIFFGDELGRFGFVSRRAQSIALRTVATRLGLRIPVGPAKTWSDHADRHRVGILRALVRAFGIVPSATTGAGRGRPVLLVDEATRLLSEDERRGFLKALTDYAAEGDKVVLFVSHDLEEAEKACDCFLVRTGPGRWKFFDERLRAKELAEAAFGRVDLRPVARKSFDGTPKPFLQLKSVADGSGCQEISLVHGGEIAAIVGDNDEERRLIFKALAFPGTECRWRVFYRGTDISDVNVWERRRRGLRFVPTRADGLVRELSVEENMALDPDRGTPWWSTRPRAGQEHEHTRAVLRDFEIQGDPWSPVGWLSGGNQQRLLIGRELANCAGSSEDGEAIPLCLIAWSPLTGIDASGRGVIFRRMANVAEAGGAVLIVTDDWRDVIDIADRIRIFQSGKLVKDSQRPFADLITQ